jgi:hypothetical protein
VFDGERPPTVTFSASAEPPRVLLGDGTAAEVQTPLPPVSKPIYHVTIQGFDCTFEMDGRGSTPCVLQRWGGQLNFVVSGAFLHQPTNIVTITAYQSGDIWFLSPYKFLPYTPLMIAVGKDDAQAVTQLLAKGADTNAHDPGLDPPLAIAVRDQRPDLAVALVQHGADANAKMLDGNTVFTSIISGSARDPVGALALINLAIAHGANVNIPTAEGLTPLMMATLVGQRDIVNTLLAHGANVNATMTPTHPIPLIGFDTVSAYDIAANLLSLATQMGAGQTKSVLGSAQGIPGIQAVMALLVAHGAAILPGTGLPDPTRIHFIPGPTAGQVTLLGVAGAAVGDETVTVTDVHSGVHADSPVAKDGSLKVSVAGVPADYYSVRLSNKVKQGHAVYLHGSDPALMMKLDPIVNAGGQVEVTGTYAGPADMGITVGESAAFLYGGRFAGGGLTESGHQTLTIAARTPGGLLVVQQLPLPPSTTVTRTVDELLVSGSRGVAVAPYALTFGIHLDGAEMKAIRISTHGDGNYDIVTSDPALIAAGASGGFKYTYTRPGLYEPTAVVTDTTGKDHPLHAWVLVQDPNRLDAMFNSLWHDLAACLVGGDRMGAMGLQWEDGQRSPVAELDYLSGPGKDIPLSNSPLVRDHFPDDKHESATIEARYHIVRAGKTGYQANYSVNFLLYPDGVWVFDMLQGGG